MRDEGAQENRLDQGDRVLDPLGVHCGVLGSRRGVDLMGLAVLIATCGRPSLATTLNSFVRQLEPGDEVLVEVNDDAPWGHKARNRMMSFARASHLLFMDDDDVYVEDALNTVRNAVAQDPVRLHIFSMLYHGDLLFKEPQVRIGNVSTQMVCVPSNFARYAKWGDRYQGDFDFIEGCIRAMGQPVWHREVIAHYQGAL